MRRYVLYVLLPLYALEKGNRKVLPLLDFLITYPLAMETAIANSQMFLKISQQGSRSHIFHGQLQEVML